MSTIKYYTIYGERCSGTNLLEETMNANFNLEVTWKYGRKHFFGFHDFKGSEDENETLFIGITRTPIDWLYSLYRTQWHIPSHNLEIKKFLLNEFYSVVDNSGRELMEHDLNMITKQKYKNIFELRKVKNDFLTKTMPNKAKNYIFITLEELASNPEKVINDIRTKFNFTLKADTIKKITYYKKYKNCAFKPREVNFSKDAIDIIKQNLDKEQENKLGYNY